MLPVEAAESIQALHSPSISNQFDSHTVPSSLPGVASYALNESRKTVKEMRLTLTVGIYARHPRILHHATRHALHHLRIGCGIEASLLHESKLLLLIVHHLRCELRLLL